MLNHVTIVGYVGNTPELKYTASGDPVCSFKVATTTNYINREGEKESLTEWHRCSAYKRTATICNEYINAGKLVLIEGSLRTNKWKKSSGETFQSTQIMIKRILFLDKDKDKEQKRNGYRYTTSLEKAVDKAVEDAFNPKFDESEIPF